MENTITLSGDRPESSLQVWSQLLESLRQSGFEHAGPEYLKLSQYIANSRKMKLLQGAGVEVESVWSDLRNVGFEVQHLLLPMLEAARLLSELPDHIIIKEVAVQINDSIEIPIQPPEIPTGLTVALEEKAPVSDTLKKNVNQPGKILSRLKHPTCRDQRGALTACPDHFRFGVTAEFKEERRLRCHL